MQALLLSYFLLLPCLAFSGTTFLCETPNKGHMVELNIPDIGLKAVVANGNNFEIKNGVPQYVKMTITRPSSEVEVVGIIPAFYDSIKGYDRYVFKMPGVLIDDTNKKVCVGAYLLALGEMVTIVKYRLGDCDTNQALEEIQVDCKKQ